jgi:signal transduction histidine kinase
MYLELTAVLIAGSAAGAVVSAMLAVGAWRDRSVPGAEPFGWLMVAAVGWCLLNVVWLTTTDPAVARAVFVATLFTSGAVVGLWVVFALVYTGREAWLTPARLAGLLLLPASYALLALTNPMHGLVTVETVRLTASGQTLFVGRTGGGYLLQLVLSIGFIGAGYVLLGEFLLRSRNLYRKQTFIILTAGLLTAGVHGLFVLGVTPHPGVDVTPLTFGLNGLIIGVALFRYDFVSVAPLAGDLLVDELPDPILVLDDDGQIIDYNAAAATLFDDDELGGRRVADVAPGLREDIERDSVFAVGDPLSYYDPQTSAITDQYSSTRGQLVVLREVTGQQRRQERLETLQAATQQFIEADQPDRVADLAVNFATRVLDREAVVFRHSDDDTLEPRAVSDALAEATGEAALSVDPEASPDHPVVRTFETAERAVAPVNDALGTALLLPLGDHGVFAIGVDDDGCETEEQHYAEILAHSTQVALEQIERERQLRGSRTSVKRRNEQIAFFNGVLRHSLRNAMLVVQGRADHLRDRVAEEHRDHVESIATWCERLTEMSGTIRDINDTVTASESERLEPVQLSAVVDAAVEDATGESRQATIETDISATEWVQANDLVRRVLTSIVDNAIVHNTSDEPHIDIGVRDAGDWVQLRVADNGPGISDDLKTTMFQRSMSPDQTAGGFGLYFVSVMMDLYGGKVWYEDNDPSGTVAILEFQRADPETTDPEGVPAAVVSGEAQHKSPDD